MTTKRAPYTGTGTADVDVEFGTGARTAATQRVTIATDDVVGLTSAATAARTSPSASATDVPLLAADPTRKGATVYNDSTAVLYVGYGATAVTSTNYSVQVPAGGYLEVPASFVQCAIRGCWVVATGAARVTAG